jgi:putative sterol carrier protein
MSDTTEEFFDGIGRGGARLLRKTAGTIRFDLERDNHIDHWFVSIERGQVQVSREKREADCVIHTDEAFFARMACGEVEPVPAWLRNDFTIEGQPRFVILLERLFPGPPGGRRPHTFACDRGSQR